MRRIIRYEPKGKPAKNIVYDTVTCTIEDEDGNVCTFSKDSVYTFKSKIEYMDSLDVLFRDDETDEMSIEDMAKCYKMLISLNKHIKSGELDCIPEEIKGRKLKTAYDSMRSFALVSCWDKFILQVYGGWLASQSKTQQKPKTQQEERPKEKTNTEGMSLEVLMTKAGIVPDDYGLNRIGVFIKQYGEERVRRTLSNIMRAKRNGSVIKEVWSYFETSIVSS